MTPNKPQDAFDQQRLFYAVAASAVILMAWQFLFPPPPPTTQPAVSEAARRDAPAAHQGAAEAGPIARLFAPPRVEPPLPAQAFEREILAELNKEDLHGLSLTNDDGQIEAWSINEAQYRLKREGSEDQPFNFIKPFSAAADPNKGFFMPPKLDLSLDGQAAQGAYTVAEKTKTTATLKYRDPRTGIHVERSYTLNPDNYTVQLKLKLENPTGRGVPFDLSARLSAAQSEEEASGGMMFMPPIHLYEALCHHGEAFEREQVSSIEENLKDDDDPTRFTDKVTWVGVDNRYFMSAFAPIEGEAEGCEFFLDPRQAGVDPAALPRGLTLLTTRMDLKGGELKPGDIVERQYTWYAGPKKLDRLRSVYPTLDNAIDFGFFAVICEPMLWLMRVFYDFGGNWGLAIILLTLFVKLLTFPLTHKQYKSMAGMKVVQPEMKALQAKYKEDKVKLQQEMMVLYKKHNINPLAGCLPLILMMPIYFALYRTIYSAVELYQADFIFWIKDLSQMDPYYVTPLLLGVLMFLQTRMNPSTGDEMQQKIMMWFMPIMFTGMMLFLPSGLVLYIAVNTVLGIAQQYVLMQKAQPQGAKA
ncbi:membrane protein insertase YidC [Myxococcota bacterium]|nr:membrane protein insertase YidC [Myxococcota bacterium]MBU1431503.1 membrane protein insertase YidC [Myxococcota bacterium]MBU1898156.1 membrane protein insertase YidC [Myxococcota bacterium]